MTYGSEIEAMLKEVSEAEPIKMTDCPGCGWSLEDIDGILHCKFCGWASSFVLRKDGG